MTDKKHLPLIKKSAGSPAPGSGEENIAGAGKSPEIHLGSSDAFMQTENPSSSDADNISDEKLDDLLDED